MRTIRIPDSCHIDDLSWGLYIAAKHAFKRGHDALGSQRIFFSTEMDRLNSPVDEADETDAVCHCDQRDAHEIAVYLTADELLAVQAVMQGVTFGSAPEGVSTRHIWKAIQEIDDVVIDRLSDPSLR